MTDNPAHPYNRRPVVTIDDLPDDDLLAIFDFYVVRYQDLLIGEMVLGIRDAVKKTRSWQSLVHVCRRWRGLVFGSPRRLNLQLYCTTKTPASGMDVWPALPLLIKGDVSETTVDNVIAQLEHSDRIRQINLNFQTNSKIEKLCTAMQAPFPELVNLYLSSGNLAYRPDLPDSILGGSAPRLRHLVISSIPFSGLPKLLSFTTHLVYLYLVNIPHSGYISPDAMATCLSKLSSLDLLQFGFQSPQSSPDQETQRPRPPSRSVIPALTGISFTGVNEYLEELVARIDTPRLRWLQTAFFNDLNFDTTELIQFVSHSPILKVPSEAHVLFENRAASINLQSQASNREFLKVEISCKESGWQLSSVAQICTTSSPLLSTTENLFIYERMHYPLDWKDGIENIEWLELLLPFTAVKNLYLSKQFAPRIAPALQEVTEGGTTEVLPALQNLYLEGFQASESIQDGIKQFVSARQLTDHPVAISVWDRRS